MSQTKIKNFITKAQLFQGWTSEEKVMKKISESSLAIFSIKDGHKRCQGNNSKHHCKGMWRN